MKYVETVEFTNDNKCGVIGDYSVKVKIFSDMKENVMAKVMYAHFDLDYFTKYHKILKKKLDNIVVKAKVNSEDKFNLYKGVNIACYRMEKRILSEIKGFYKETINRLQKEILNIENKQKELNKYLMNATGLEYKL